MVSAEGDVDKLLLVIIVGDLGTMLPKIIKAKDIQINDLIISIIKLGFNIKCNDDNMWTRYVFNPLTKHITYLENRDRSEADSLSSEECDLFLHLLAGPGGKNPGGGYKKSPIHSGIIAMLHIKECEEAEDAMIAIFAMEKKSKIDNSSSYKKYDILSEQDVFLIERQG